jgi:uncharacterized protein DUF488/glyoxalase/bleomycin resistance protein/dioxygenase superfamily protein
MAIRIVQLGNPRQSGEGPRLGTIRRPPRGVRKRDYAREDYFDIWLPDLAPSAALVAFAKARPAGPWPGKMAFYIDVDDIDAYTRKIVSGGGKIVVDKKDVPGVGQLALFEDPGGRVLGLWKQSNRGSQWRHHALSALL